MNLNEIDRKLAIKLMGWVEVVDVDPPYQGNVYKMPSGQTRIIMDHCDMRLPEKFVPSREISQSIGDGGEGTVVGEMRKKGWLLELAVNRPGIINAFSATFTRFDRVRWANAQATPSLAVCLAAEKVIDSWEDTP